MRRSSLDISSCDYRGVVWVGPSDLCSLESLSGSTMVSTLFLCAACFHSTMYAWRLHVVPT